MKAQEFLQAGDFNVRLSVEAPSAIADGCGGQTINWVHEFDIWARLIPIKGILIQQANTENLELTHWIYIRKRNDINTAHRFKAGVRVFEIDALYDPDETGRYLLCQAREKE